MKVVIVEDHLMFREILRTLCTHTFNFQVAGEAGNGPEAVREVVTSDPDLLLLDIELGGFDGFTAINRIRERKFSPRILIISSHCDDYTIFRVERAAVHGFIDKNGSSLTDLKAAISSVAEGGAYFSEKFKKLKYARSQDRSAFDSLLSNRERTILVLVGQLLTDFEISGHLDISDETVEKHRFNMQKKLCLKSRIELVRYARDHGFIEKQQSHGSRC